MIKSGCDMKARYLGRASPIAPDSGDNTSIEHPIKRRLGPATIRGTERHLERSGDYKRS